MLSIGTSPHAFSGSAQCGPVSLASFSRSSAPFQSPQRSHLLLAHIDEYVSEDNPARAVEAFAEELDLGKLGFVRVELNPVKSPTRAGVEAQSRADVADGSLGSGLQNVSGFPRG